MFFAKLRERIGFINEWLSQGINVFTGGYPDEMFSARAFRTKNWTLFFIDLVFGQGHCEEMYKYEWSRKSQHPHYNQENRPSDI